MRLSLAQSRQEPRSGPLVGARVGRYATTAPAVDKSARARTELRPVELLADAEPSEYFAEQIIGGKLACDRSERRLRQPQFFGEEF